MAKPEHEGYIHSLQDDGKHRLGIGGFNGISEIDLKPHQRQIGGDHYKDMTIEPSEFIHRNNIPWLEGNAIKYICRHATKHGKQDIDKAIHYLELLKEWKYGG